MRVIEVRLSVEVVVPLLEVLTEAAELLREKPSSAVHLASLPDDLREIWRNDLLSGQASDIDQLLGLFGPKFFKEGLVYLDEQSAEPVLRACAAVRLQLHRRHLQGLSEEELESGEVEVDHLTEPLRRAFVAYLFLATLQELILNHLNPVGE